MWGIQWSMLALFEHDRLLFIIEKLHVLCNSYNNCCTKGTNSIRRMITKIKEKCINVDGWLKTDVCDKDRKESSFKI